MSYYESWDAFCEKVFDECGSSGRYLKMLYGAGGMVLLMFVVSLLGFSPFLFLTTVLGFLLTPVGMIVAAALGALAVPAFKKLFSDRKTLRPVLTRLIAAKPQYEQILASHPSAISPERIQAIDGLLALVIGEPPVPPRSALGPV